MIRRNLGLLTILSLASLSLAHSSSHNSTHQSATDLRIRVQREPSAAALSISDNPKPQPVADVRLYLLDDDLENILYDAGLRRQDQLPRMKSTSGLAELFGRALWDPRGNRKFYDKAMKALERHTVRTATTNDSGDATLHTVVPGSYYIVGFAEVGRFYALWNLKTRVKAGENSIILRGSNVVSGHL